MRTKESTDRLGRLISSHSVANRRRWISGLVGTTIAAPGVFLMVYSVLDPHNGKTAGKLIGLALMLVVVGFPIAVLQLSRAVRGGWREAFDVHEWGLVHRGWRVRSWTWEQVGMVRVRWDTDGTLWRRLGWNFRCSIRFAGGSRVRVDGLAANGRQIAETVVAQCPAALLQVPALGWRLPPFLIAMFAGALVGLTWYAIANSGERTVQLPYGATTTEPMLSDAVNTLLAMGIAVSLIGLVFSVIFEFIRRSRR